MQNNFPITASRMKEILEQQDIGFKFLEPFDETIQIPQAYNGISKERTTTVIIKFSNEQINEISLVTQPIDSLNKIIDFSVYTLGIVKNLFSESRFETIRDWVSEFFLQIKESKNPDIIVDEIIEENKRIKLAYLKNLTALIFTVSNPGNY